MSKAPDLEMKTAPRSSGSNASPPPMYEGVAEQPPRNAWGRFVDSFKEDPSSKLQNETKGGKQFDLEAAAAATADSPLAKRLKGRHLQMIAIGGSIGTGLFVGSGSALATGGPASLILAYGIIGIMLYCTVHALGEMAVLFPVAGSFSAYSTRFIDPAWGFAMGWNYALQWMITLPLEIVAACLTIQFWTHGSINNDAWVIIFLLIIALINLFGVRGYGEAEFIFSIIKVVAVVGFVILGIIITVGGGPNGSYIGARYWYEPGAFNGGFKGLCSVFVTAAFAFSGTELVGLGAAETANPRKALPTAIKQVFWRICLFYLVSLTIVGCLVSYENPQLIGNNSADANASPFVIAIREAGIDVLPSIFNVVILISVLSVGNSSVYGSSRTLAALAAQGQAPRILGFIDRSGRPMAGIVATILFGFLAFFAGSDKEQDAFNWMIAISGLSSIFTWTSICFCHIRFRKAWRGAGHTLDELAFRSQPGVIGSWLGFILNILILIAQFWIGFAPIGYDMMTAGELVQNWFQVYLAFPVVLLFYIPYKIWYRTPFMRTKDMDLQTGRRELDLIELIAEERAERAQWSRTRKIYKFFC